MIRFLIDANVLLDIATGDPAWSQGQIRTQSAIGTLLVNPIIYAELATGFFSADQVDFWLDRTLFQRVPLPYEAGWLAAQVFLMYRRSGGLRSSPLPDFYIGAHAEVEKLTLITRDAARYRTYFPNVTLVTP